MPAHVQLNVVLDGVAALRQRRLARDPDPVAIALLAEQAGASGVTLRLRTDRAEILDRDVELVAEVLRAQMNLRLAASAELLGIAARVKPARCCLVAEQRHDHAPGGGLDAARVQARLAAARDELKSAGIEVAARVDPVIEHVDACARAGLDAVEIHCGAYALASGRDAIERRSEELARAARHAAAAGLRVYAGGGLDYRNVLAIVALEPIMELRIGHAILANAVSNGICASIAHMRQLLARCGAQP